MIVRTVSGRIFGAGFNDSGALGNGAVISAQATPVQFQLPAGETAVSVTGSEFQMFVLTGSGKVFGAGRNAYGELGDGTQIQRSTPVQFPLPAGETARAVRTFGFPAGSAESVYVLTVSGKVFGAGGNEVGQLGDATNGNVRTTPGLFQLPVGEIAEDLTEVADYAKSVHSVWVRTRSGKVFGAGSNQFGQLGDGTTTDASTPVRFQVPAGESITDFEAGLGVAQSAPFGQNGTLAAALTASGKVFGAGYNFDGELGDGSMVDRSTPVLFILPAGETASQLSVSGSGIRALTATGRVFGSGRNEQGQLGTGALLPIYDSTPARIAAGVATPVEFPQPLDYRAVSVLSHQAPSVATDGATSDAVTFVVSCPRRLSVGDLVFEDSNHNGVRDVGERLVSGVKVRLFKDGASSVLAEDTTDANGAWLFTGLLPGSYQMEITLPAGFENSVTTATSGDPTNGNDNDNNGVTTSGKSVRSKVFVLALGGGPKGETAARPDPGTLDVDGFLTVGFGIFKAPQVVPALTPIPVVATPPPVRSPQAVTRARLSVRKVASRRSLYGGQRVSFVVTARNVGSIAALDVRVCDRLPASLTFVGQISEKARSKVRMESGQVCVNLGRVAAHGSRSVTFVTRVVDSTLRGTVTNTATAVADNASQASGRASVMVLGPKVTVAPAVTG